MKKFTALIITVMVLLLSLTACNNTVPDESNDTSSNSESSNAQKLGWYYVPFSQLKYKYSKIEAFYNGDHPFINMSKDESADKIKLICDEEGDFLSTTIINETKPSGKYIYYNDKILEYSIAATDELNNKYVVVIGLLPEQYRGMDAETILKTETDYYKLFDIKTGKTVTAGIEIEYAYRNADESVNSFAFAVIKEKWFALAVPENLENKDANEPQAIFEKTVFESLNAEKSDAFMISTAKKVNGITVTETSAIKSDSAKGIIKKYTIYGTDGKKVNSFKASSFHADPQDQTGRVWHRRDYNAENNTISKQHYCNIFGEKLILDDATDIICINQKDGEYIGVYNDELFIFDGGEKAEKVILEYESIKAIESIEAVKYNETLYGLLKNGKPYRLFETDIQYDDAALEYKREYNAIFIGGDAVFAVVNSKGELVETPYYSDFEKDPKGRGYLLGHIKMSLEGDTHILDSETFEILAYLPTSVDYEFTSDGKIKVFYNDYENNGEYVEFTVTVENAIKNYNEQFDHGCFTGYPTEEDFK